MSKFFKIFLKLCVKVNIEILSRYRTSSIRHMIALYLLLENPFIVQMITLNYARISIL